MSAPYRCVRTLQLIDAMQGVLKRYPDRIARSGKPAALMGIEARAIENVLQKGTER